MDEAAAKLLTEYFNDTFGSFVYVNRLKLRHETFSEPYVLNMIVIEAGQMHRWGTVINTYWNAVVMLYQLPESREQEWNPVVQTITNTWKWNKNWNTYYQQFATWYTQKMQQQAFANAQASARASQNRLQQIFQTQQESSDMIMSGYWQRSSSMDNVFQMQHEATMGVNTFIDDDNYDYLEVDSRYDYVWSSGSDYIVTDDPGLDPNESGTEQWKLLSKE